jgi:WD40 repeat protein
MTRRLDQALLLALEADRIAETDESRDALVATVQRTSGIESILSGEEVSAQRIAVSVDGATVAVIDNTGRLTIWDGAGHRVGAPLSLPLDPRQGEPAVAVSPDGLHVAAATGGDVAWLVHVRRPGQPIRVNSGTYLPEGGNGPLLALAFSPDSVYLVGVYAPSPGTGNRSLGVLRWEVAAARGDDYWAGASAHSFGYTLAGTGSSDVVLAPTASTVAYVAGSGVVVADVATGRRIRTLPTEAAGANGHALLAVSDDGTRLATVRANGTAVLWDLVNGKKQSSYATRTRPTAIAFSGDGQELLLGTEDGDVRVFNADTGLPTGPPLAADVAGIVDVAESSGAGRLVTVGEDGMVMELSASHAGSLERVIASAPNSHVLAADGDGRTIALARNDGAVSIVSIADGAVRASMRERPGDQSVGMFDARDQTLWLAGNDGRLWRWDTSPGGKEAHAETRHDGSPLAISADGRYVAARQNASTGNVIVQAAGVPPVKPFVAPLPKRPLAGAFAPDGGQLAIAFSDGTVEILDPAHPSVAVRELVGHRGAVQDIAYNRDGSLLASVGSDGTLRLWSADDGAPVGEAISGASGSLHDVAFVHGGRVVATLGDSGLRFWDLERRVPLGEGVPFPREDRAGQLTAAPAGAAVVMWHDLVVRIDDLLWTDDRARLAARVCELVRRSLTREELAQFEPGAQYHEQCQGTQPVAR